MSARGLLSTCEQEPLHRSGAIQPHGALLIVNAEHEVLYVSANVASYVGRAPDELLGSSSAMGWFPEVASLKPEVGAQSRYSVRSVGSSEMPVDVVLTRRQGGGVCVELLGGAACASPPSFVPGPATAAELLGELAKELPFERLMYYQFRDDEDGEVLEEVRHAPDIGSYLGLRFPAADIPQVARALYRTNPWRLIPDATAEAIPIVGLFGGPPDLSRSDLRSVSPLHCAYLANMGVRASLSIPVAVGGRLSALIACHHRRPQHVSNSLLGWARRVVDAYQLHHFTQLSRERMRVVDGAWRRWSHILEDLRAFPSAERWPQVAAELASHFEVDAVALHREGVWLQSRSIPAPLLEAVLVWVQRQARVVCTSESFTMEANAVDTYCGFTAIGYGWGSLKTWLVLLRREHIHEVAWGGRPDKPHEFDVGAFPISPRRSFERWAETRRGYCRPWSKQSTLLALQLRSQLHAAAQR